MTSKSIKKDYKTLYDALKEKYVIKGDLLEEASMLINYNIEESKEMDIKIKELEKELKYFKDAQIAYNNKKPNSYKK
jgi:hypothetical protein